MQAVRPDGRAPHQLRPVRITRKYLEFAEGSCLIEIGRTRVLCAASTDENAPSWLPPDHGWITAEYAMLPKSSPQRVTRDQARGKPRGRTHEIQRLIGRSLRAVTDLSLLGSRQIILDCDVIQADGGTRTAAVTGSYLALVDCLRLLESAGLIARWPLRHAVAAVSVGIINGVPLLDLCYKEDSMADVDLNLVMDAQGRIVEIQGTAEETPFSTQELSSLIELGAQGIHALLRIQKESLTSKT